MSNMTMTSLVCVFCLLNAAGAVNSIEVEGVAPSCDILQIVTSQMAKMTLRCRLCGVTCHEIRSWSSM